MTSHHADFLGYYEQYKHKVFSFLLYRLRGERALAEDLTSDVFLKAYEKFETYDSTYAFNTWIYTIARNVCIDHVRKHKEIVDLEQVVEVEDPDVVRIEEKVDISQQMDRVHAFLGQLPILQRECIILKHLEGMSTKEIADATGESEENVRQAVSRGLKKLRIGMISIFLLLCSLLPSFLS